VCWQCLECAHRAATTAQKARSDKIDEPEAFGEINLASNLISRCQETANQKQLGVQSESRRRGDPVVSRTLSLSRCRRPRSRDCPHGSFLSPQASRSFPPSTLFRCCDRARPLSLLRPVSLIDTVPNCNHSCPTYITHQDLSSCRGWTRELSRVLLAVPSSTTLPYPASHPNTAYRQDTWHASEHLLDSPCAHA
jgi:hypothetical protein